jgi:hypothetical protein
VYDIEVYAMVMVKFKGQEIPLKVAAKIFIKAWEEMERVHLKNLMFRIPIVYKKSKNPGSDFVHEHDYNLCLTNELVYRIFKMPKVGTRKSFVEAFEEKQECCFDENGELVSFEPTTWDLVKWAEEKGYYIEFDEIAVVEEF